MKTTLHGWFGVNDMAQKTNALDNEGFFKAPDLWSHALARKMAKNQFDMKLTEPHMKAIEFVRGYYVKWGGLPMVKTIREQLQISSEQFDHMFKRGTSSARGVLCKISGLPKNLCVASGC